VFTARSLRPLVLPFVLIALVAGCTSAHMPTPGASSSLSLPSAAPAATKKVELLRWNLPGGEPSTLDPVKIYNGSDLLVEANLCESLLTLKADGGVQPGLATSIDRPNDTTYVVHLRAGVTFGDGKPMTAADVVFSLDRIRDPQAGSYWGFFARNVRTIAADDASTVTITMTKPDAIYYQMLATPMAQVVEKAFVRTAGAGYGSPKGGVMCTGPYTVQDWSPGNKLVLKENDTWWGRAANPQHAQSVQFSFLTDDSTATEALLNGDIDGSFNIPETTIDKLLGAHNGAVYIGPSTAQLVLIPTKLSGGSSLSNTKVREAFAKSIDYAGLLSTILNHVSQSLRAAMPPGGWGTARATYEAAWNALPKPAQDVTGAKALLKDSGVTHPTITLAVPADSPEYVTIGEVIKSNAEQAGFTVTLKPLPGADFGALFSNPAARGKVDVFLADYYADIPDPTELYTQFGIPGGAADFGGYHNPEVAAQLTQAVGTVDDQERAKLTASAQATLTKDLVWIPLAYPLQTLFLSNKLGGANAAFPSVMYSPWLPAIGGR
jgi:peptide/nickel transport system substrate-binding protein